MGIGMLRRHRAYQSTGAGYKDRQLTPSSDALRAAEAVAAEGRARIAELEAANTALLAENAALRAAENVGGSDATDPPSDEDEGDTTVADLRSEDAPAEVQPSDARSRRRR